MNLKIDIKEIIRLREEGYTFRQIGRILNCSYETVRLKYRKIERVYIKRKKQTLPSMRCPNCNEIVKLNFNPLRKFGERFGKRCPRCRKTLWKVTNT